jgi:hypothetical protein
METNAQSTRNVNKAPDRPWDYCYPGSWKSLRNKGIDRGNPRTPDPRTRAARPPQKKRTPKQCSTYIIPGQSFPHREMGGVNLEKKMGEGHSQTISSTLGNNLAYPIDAGPSQAIRRPIKGGGHGIIPNAYRDYRPERLTGGGPSA